MRKAIVLGRKVMEHINMLLSYDKDLSADYARALVLKIRELERATIQQSVQLENVSAKLAECRREADDYIARFF